MQDARTHAAAARGVAARGGGGSQCGSLSLFLCVCARARARVAVSQLVVAAAGWRPAGGLLGCLAARLARCRPRGWLPAQVTAQVASQGVCTPTTAGPVPHSVVDQGPQHRRDPHPGVEVGVSGRQLHATAARLNADGSGPVDDARSSFWVMGWYV